jgi:hypothetical protein
MTVDIRLNKKALVVLSTGRAGTSMLMQVLQAMGLRLSENLIPPKWENPDGFFEDAEIVELHKNLWAQLGAKGHMPLPDDWQNRQALKAFRPAVRSLLEKQITKDDRLWGFKDPRTCSLLPVWFEVMRSLWVTPVFVLAVRRPEEVVQSLVRNYPLSVELAELIWLFRTCDALRHTSGACFIAHYEDWFSEPTRMGNDLLNYSGLHSEYQGNLHETLQGIVKPSLNRSVHQPYVIKNKFVHELYAVLQECRGENFDRRRLMQVVADCQGAIEGFKAWYLEALKPPRKDDAPAKGKDPFNHAVKGESKNVDEISLAAENLTVKNNQHLKEILHLSRRNEELRIRV